MLLSALTPLLLLASTRAASQYPLVRQPTSWQHLGPFPLGTREAPLLPDPAIRHASTRHFSILVDGGELDWSVVTEDEDGLVTVGEEDEPRVR